MRQQSSGPAPARPRLIQTVWGVGYRFDPTHTPTRTLTHTDAEGKEG